jgi:hypothetical protein
MLHIHLKPLFIAILIIILGGCASSNNKKKSTINPRYQPAQNLLQILTDFQRHLDDDSYRFESPKDVTGKNIFKATLIRLDNYQKSYPNTMVPIVYYSRAKALEKLHDYTGAIRNYQFLLKVEETRLSQEARKNLAICREFEQVKTSFYNRDSSLQERLSELNKERKGWEKLIKKYQGTPYEYLAREEEERVEVASIKLLITQGAKESIIIQAFQDLIARHQSSKNIDQHWLSLANFYFSRAREYATLYDPEGLQFDPKVFNRYIGAAGEIFARVANERYGKWERIEAQASLEAIRAFATRILSLNQ